MGARSWVLLVVALVATGLALFVVDFPRPMSNDMAPGIRKGDLLLACRVCGKPKLGDVVLFSAPDNGAVTLRRVVAGPGDRVEVKKGKILVNDQPLDDTAAGIVKLADIDPVSSEPRPFALFNEQVGGHNYRVVRDLGVNPAGDRAPETLADSYFLAADRRTLVRDSRDYGPIPRTSIRSIALRVLSAGDHDAERQGKIP
jgi:signal peptidase I